MIEQVHLEGLQGREAAGDDDILKASTLSVDRYVQEVVHEAVEFVVGGVQGVERLVGSGGGDLTGRM